MVGGNHALNRSGSYETPCRHPSRGESSPEDPNVRPHLSAFGYHQRELDCLRDHKSSPCHHDGILGANGEIGDVEERREYCSTDDCDSRSSSCPGLHRCHFFSGQSQSHADASKTWADVQKFIPAVRASTVQCKRVQNALDGFSKRALAESREPAPEEVYFAIIGQLIHRGNPLVALNEAVRYLYMGRPGEIDSLLVKQLVPPVGKHKFWSVLLGIQEDRRPGKTGEYDEGVVLDQPLAVSLSSAFAALVNFREPNYRIWPIENRVMSHQFDLMVQELGMSDFHIITRYGSRHAAASHDLYHQQRSFIHRGKRARQVEVGSIDAKIFKSCPPLVLHKSSGSKAASVRRSRPDPIASIVSRPKGVEPCGVSGVSSHRHLKQLLINALSISRRQGHHRIGLELFSGSGRIGHSVSRAGIGCVCLDIKFGEHHDLTNHIVQKHIVGWLSSGVCSYVCVDWSSLYVTVGVVPGTTLMAGPSIQAVHLGCA